MEKSYYPDQKNWRYPWSLLTDYRSIQKNLLSPTSIRRSTI